MNFPKFSESKGILKIGWSEVCVSGGSSRVGLLNQEYVYIYIFQRLFGSQNALDNVSDYFTEDAYLVI